MDDIMTLKEAAEKWSISERRINELILRGRIGGARKVGTTWIIPSDASKPPDRRCKNNKPENKSKE